MPHLSVMPLEVLNGFAGLECAIFVDGTTGAGGHSQLMLQSHGEITKLIAIDQDPMALQIAKTRLAAWDQKIVFIHDNFKNLASILAPVGKVNGILLDLGVSSMQLDNQERGFSFMREGPLDMRMDPTQSLTAKEIINTWSEADLGYIFREYGDEKRWKVAAHAIVHARVQGEITTTKQLADILHPFFKWNPKKKIDPRTLLFQGLRIAVNGELALLEQALKCAIAALAPEGRLAVISFHSLEDRIVKNCFRFAADDKYSSSGIGGLFLEKTPEIKLLTKGALTPTEEEIRHNPRSRSAKLRIVQKL